MDIATFRKRLTDQADQIITFFEGNNIGLIELKSKADFEPCQIIAEGRHHYYVLYKDGLCDERPKRQYQIVYQDRKRSEYQRKHETHKKETQA